MMIISGNKYEAGYQIVAMADRRLQTTKDNWKPYFMKIIVTWKFLRCFLWYSANWKLRGLWDAMCAIYRCLIPSSLYQPGSNSVMRNIILLKFIFCLWCLMSDRQCHRFQPESDLQSKLLSGCFPGIVLDLWTLVSECCFFFPAVCLS